MSRTNKLPLRDVNEDEALRTIFEGTATDTGARFFKTLVQNLAKALHTHGAWVTEYLKDSRRLRAMAFWMDGEWIQGYEIDIAGTPCEDVVEKKHLIHIPDNLVNLYPRDDEIDDIGAVSYLGMPLLGLDGEVLGHVAVIDRRPIPEESRVHAIFKIFGARATAELQRIRAEAKVREREEKLGRLVDSALDAIIELNPNLEVTRLNPAAETFFNTPAEKILGQPIPRFLTESSHHKLKQLVEDLKQRPEGKQYAWIPGGLKARREDGKEIMAEATLSHFEMSNQSFHTLILRDVDERLAAEEKIRALTSQTQYLQEELKDLQNSGEIIGQSTSLLQALQDVKQVAETEASVLILGETGTGKEVFARAIHNASPRREKPFVKVNCAAIPATLIESEFFGHQKGAFTGATQNRIGRFALADQGTIFLDEIGELPIDLQSKLLRVLQEGEFEQVGSSTTRKVDCRVIAATNQNLEEAIQAGTFREDLYYRLNVFPLVLPPLRERKDDIPLLASAFLKRFAKRMGRTYGPLSQDNLDRLGTYNWPGNVREMENVIERAMITSPPGQLSFERALPNSNPIEAHTPDATQADTPIRTVLEMQALERANIIRALKACAGRVSGADGAAKLLGLNPSTLTSRMKALDIKRP